MRPSARSAFYLSFRAHIALVDLMDADLRRECDAPLEWYDVLRKVSEAPGGRIRMRDLADEVLLSRSWLTRRVDQLERAGLLARERAEGDGRAVIAVLTEGGWTRYREMEQVHAASIRRHFSAHVSPDEVPVIAAVFQRMGDAAWADAVALRHADAAP